MTATVLVTGATGALGSRAVQRLRSMRWTVRCLVRSRSVEGADELVHGDLRDGTSLEAAVRGAGCVLHLAAVTHARRARAYLETNHAGTERLVAAAERAGIRRFVHVSTRAVSESGGAYSLSKHMAESVVRRATMEHTIIRLPELYGLGGTEGVDRMLDLARKGASIPLVGDGGDELCPMYADDAVHALTAALTVPAAARKTYTLGGECMTVRAFAEASVGALSSSSRLLPIPVAVVAALGWMGRVLPVPVYPDQLARLRCEKPPVSPEAEPELGFTARTLAQGLAELA